MERREISDNHNAWQEDCKFGLYKKCSGIGFCNIININQNIQKYNIDICLGRSILP